MEWEIAIFFVVYKMNEGLVTLYCYYRQVTLSIGCVHFCVVVHYSAAINTL